jgi:drug/metabolite transporter (DMT)-like permease
MTPASRPALAWFLLIILSLVWGSSFILMLLGLKGFDAFQLALIRMSVAGVCMGPFAVMYSRQVTLKETLLLFIVGLTGNGIPAFLFAQAETQLPSAVVGILNSMSPIFTLLVGYVFFQLRFPAMNVLGVWIGFIGAALLALAGGGIQEGRANLHYSLMVVAATICYGINVNVVKKYFPHRNPVLIASMALTLVGLPSLILLLALTDFTERVSIPGNPAALLFIAILGAVGTALGVVLFNKLLQISSLIFATSVTYTIPVVALLWGFLLREDLTLGHGLGFAVILLGVWLANRK